MTKAVKKERNSPPLSPKKNKEQQIIDLCDELSEKVPSKKKAANQSTKGPKEAEYEIQTLKRLEKLIELRRQREEYRRKKEARRQERREQRDKKKEERAANRSPRSQSLPRQVMHNTNPLNDSMMPGMIVDLTDICDRRQSPRCTASENARKDAQQQQPDELELNSVKVKRWKSSFQEEIPVIVDVSNRARPKQIYDLTKLSEPPLLPPPSPPRSNHRLAQLRREREQRYNDFATTFTMLAHNEYRSDDKPLKSKKKKKKHDKKEFEVQEVDDKLMMYYNMMDKVSRNLKMSFCGGGSGSRTSL
jgi:DNA repair exonuclease SbcCD ATPase subunit